MEAYFLDTRGEYVNELRALTLGTLRLSDDSVVSTDAIGFVSVVLARSGLTVVGQQRDGLLEVGVPARYTNSVCGHLRLAFFRQPDAFCHGACVVHREPCLGFADSPASRRRVRVAASRPMSFESLWRGRVPAILQRACCAKWQVQRLHALWLSLTRGMREACASNNVHTGSACGVIMAYEVLCGLQDGAQLATVNDECGEGAYLRNGLPR